MKFDVFIPRNKRSVITNPDQGTDKKVVCVCSAGILRSPTAANVLHKEFGFNTRSCGIIEEYALIALTPQLLLWADEIVCMESWQSQQIYDHLQVMKISRPVVCLHLPDNFDYMDDELVELIKTRYLKATTAD